MALPTTLNEHAKMSALLEQLRNELAEGALRGSTRCGFVKKREQAMGAMLALLYASKQIANDIGMLELYEAMCAAEVPASRVGQAEAQ
jgi:hypothetical protein